MATAGRLIRVPVAMMWWPLASKVSGAEASAAGSEMSTPIQPLIMRSISLK